MILDMEMRWRLGRANRLSVSIPKKLQYRVLTTGILMTPDGEKPTRQWSEWRDVPRVSEPQ